MINDLDRFFPISFLFQHLPVKIISPLPEIIVNGVVSDSRLIQPGNLFVAVSGGNQDGHRFIPEAARRGAAAAVGSISPESTQLGDPPIPYIQVSDSRQALAYLAAAYYGFPAQKLTVIGVTGTDGKTTTTNLIHRILSSASIPTGMISTVNAQIGEESLDTGFHVTTPDAPEVQGYLAHMLDAGLTHVVIEATSHGLAQSRVDACEFDVGVITNITHEHLDYHGSYEAYRDAKARLFTQLALSGSKMQSARRTAILNRDDASFDFLVDYLTGLEPVSLISYGMHHSSDLRAEHVESDASGMRFTATSKGLSIPVTSRLFGEYNVSNCLAAMAATWLALGVGEEAVRQGIASFTGVPGRMETIDLGQDFTAIVDFAHTPNALRQALLTARRMTRGRVIAVFGSAGLRDRAKRRMMAEISVALADITILTAEDPRSESLNFILEEMATGASKAGGSENRDFWRIPDRGEAIRFAISSARRGDLVMACGKGHEQSMCFGDVEYEWDDRIAMRAALAEYLGMPGPRMPYLPTQGRRLTSSSIAEDHPNQADTGAHQK